MSNRDTRYIDFARSLITELEGEHALRGDIIQKELETLIAQRVYDLVTPDEWIDKATRVRMTVERDIPDHPRVTVICPDGHSLSFEQVSEAIKRLCQMAGLPQMDDPYEMKEKEKGQA